MLASRTESDRVPNTLPTASLCENAQLPTPRGRSWGAPGQCGDGPPFVSPPRTCVVVEGCSKWGSLHLARGVSRRCPSPLTSSSCPLIGRQLCTHCLVLTTRQVPTCRIYERGRCAKSIWHWSGRNWDACFAELMFTTRAGTKKSSGKRVVSVPWKVGLLYFSDSFWTSWLLVSRYISHEVYTSVCNWCLWYVRSITCDMCKYGGNAHFCQ